MSSKYIGKVTLDATQKISAPVSQGTAKPTPKKSKGR